MNDLIEAVEAIRKKPVEFNNYENNYRTGWWDACNTVLKLLHDRLKQVGATSMSEHHPITPPLWMVQQWAAKYWGDPNCSLSDEEEYIAAQAARWGADQQLEACLKWFRKFYKGESWMLRDLKKFRDTMRPKPPSLKEQALLALSHLEKGAEPQMDATEAAYTIRRALEALPDD